MVYTGGGGEIVAATNPDPFMNGKGDVLQRHIPLIICLLTNIK